MVERANVVVRAGRIAAFARDAPIPDGLRAIDGTGETLLPGLIDAHVHVFPGAQADALRFGVTAELDMFNTSHEFAKWRAQRDSLARTHEADTWSAGTGINVAGGHPAELGDPGAGFPALGSAADAQAFVDARVAEGSDNIKLLIEDLAEFGKAGASPRQAPGFVRVKQT
jgi:dihydroorotase-like cyclic amidohydrolase